MEQEQSKPKIDMVVKCIDNFTVSKCLTLNKYYSAKQVKTDHGYLYKIIDDNDEEHLYGNAIFKVFKVGDRFNWECDNIIYVIIEFEYIGNSLAVHLREEQNQCPWRNWKIESFDKAFIKIEEEPKSGWQPKFEIGDWVMHEDYIGPLEVVRIKHNGYNCLYADGCIPVGMFDNKFTDNSLTIWQPMKDLKDQLATKDKEIAELKEALKIRLYEIGKLL